MQIRQLLWKALIFIAGTASGTVLGWVTEDVAKRPVLAAIESATQRYIPRDSSFVQYWWPNVITFNSTDFSGCSGGEISRFVAQAKEQGLLFRDDEIVSTALLCQKWIYHGSAKAILSAMSIKFSDCFDVDSQGTFELRLNGPFLCKTDYALNPKTNDWVKTPGAVTVLCLPRAVKTRMSPTEPIAHECPESELRRLQFIQ
jgi:hypothetical protein